jgi:hemerythrin-like metal-binding protein
MENLLYIIWSDRYSTGISIIDEQHRGIVSAINSLHYFIGKGSGDEVLHPILKFLEQYIIIHFKTEEGLMSEAGYPDLRQHILMHEELSKKTEKFSRELTQNNDTDAVLRFLREWWLTHINQEDRKYAPYILKLVRNN